MNPSSPPYLAALAIAHRLRDAGHQAFFAGGCVRDLLLGLEPKDFDVATSATPDQIVALFPKTFAVGAHFGVVLVASSDGQEIATEVATFRNDGAYSDGRHPDAVRLRRRAKTSSAATSPSTECCSIPSLRATGDIDRATLDFVRGREDLAAGIIRAIGDPALRFAEDKLRMLRAVRSPRASTSRSTPQPPPPSAARRRDRTRSAPSASATNSPASSPRAARAVASNCSSTSACSPKSCLKPSACTASSSRPSSTPRATSGRTPCCCWKSCRPAARSTLAWGALLHDIGKPATYQPPNPAIPGNDRDSLQRPRRGRRPHRRDHPRPSALLARRHRADPLPHRKPHALRRRPPDEAVHPEALPPPAPLRRAPRLAPPRRHLRPRRPHLYNFARAQFEAEPTPDLRPAPLLTGRDLIAAG